MRLKDIEIGIMEQKGRFAIMVCGGKGLFTNLPEFGETKSSYSSGKG